MDSVAILYKVYVKTNDSGVIIAIDSDAFITDTTSWTEIDSGYTDKYHHAQTQYLENGLTDIDGAFNYKLVDGVVTERTDEEKAADIPEIEVPIPMYNTTVSNPNLLINPDFKINQRGQTEYTAMDAAKYGVDRWKCCGKSICSPVSSGLKISCGEDSATAHSFIIQVIEGGGRFAGKTVTFSVDVSEMTATAGMISIWANDTHVAYSAFSSIGVVVVSAMIPTDTTLLHVRIDGARTGATLGQYSIIRNTKLELGSVATPFTLPDPATELVKCQRYYEVLMDEFVDRNIIGSVNPTTRKAIFDIPFKVTKRVVPSLASGKVRLIVSDLNTNTIVFNNIDDLEIVQGDKNGIAVTAIIPDTVTLNTTCVPSIDTRVEGIPAFAVSAEL